ncbi:MAG TPA: hypothetical protein VHU41_11765 [Thermoanaerobaculia bacterium]|jgi:hypothetical protein|nr:hypothetical protein [Thermoanaerobaculia bacterium]
MVLVRLLLTHRLRSLQRQYGLPVLLTTSAIVAAVVLKLSSIFGHVLAIEPLQRLGPALDSVWVGWLVMGVVTGRDMTWHIRLDRALTFRLPFRRLYLLDTLLAFASVPLLIVFGIVTFYGIRSGWPLRQWPLALIGVVLFVVSVRASVSVVRAVLFSNLGILPRVAMAVAATVFAAARLVPGDRLARTLRGSAGDLGILSLIVLATVAIDYPALRKTVYSGLIAPRSVGVTTKARLLTARPHSIPPLWRASLLGWLRNRSALLLFLWGTTYGFAYTYFMNVSGAVDFVLFTWMVLIFHSYLRGNLLGVDNAGFWQYSLLGVPTDRLLQVKNSTLTLLQSIMAGSVLFAAVLRPTSGVTTATDWACLLGFAVAAILSGELAGTVFSILHSEPIDRTSMYSGGLTMGALAIPAIQLVLAIGYVVAFVAPLRMLPLAAKWIVFLGVPVCLAIIRWRALPIWRASLLERAGEDLLAKLSAVTP